MKVLFKLDWCVAWHWKQLLENEDRLGSFQPTNEMMLKFYSFYKQATQGPCNIPRPGFWDPIGRYKWDAWSALGDMSKEEAMIAYVEEMKKCSNWFGQDAKA
ncbi:acyl- -binding domain-containing protein 5 isoform x1 [Limosa lapponica baueri]|uniref:Acyl--binding domain-containing protein 5 isoform x1 n=1 Tax=Limosa lapponica baueri TaxID=1758121 RepID=A0A2I0TD80_LIMLA|nr:acyl- -binding domain-containing protein 5 isoform x1 [Limosa lapponica baueri]